VFKAFVMGTVQKKCFLQPLYKPPVYPPPMGGVVPYPHRGMGGGGGPPQGGRGNRKEKPFLCFFKKKTGGLHRLFFF